MKYSTLLLLFGGITGTLADNIQVYLQPPPASQFDDVVPLKQANIVIAHHLGLEEFETLGSYQLPQENFVGVGQDDVAVIAMSEEEAEEIIPEDMELTFVYDSSLSVTRMVSKYVQRASHHFSRIFTTSSQTHEPHRVLDLFDLLSTPASDTFRTEAASLMKFYDSDESEKFGAFQITSLKQMRDYYGRDSEEYQVAKATFSGIISSLNKPKTKLAIFVYPSVSVLRKRQPPQSPLPPPSPKPAEPISAISTCYTSADACADATDSCTGHGQCVAASKAGRTCYVCACTATRSTDGQGRNKTHNWAGDACERLDVSGPFVLLTGTTIALIVLIVGSIGLLGGVGGQELPSTLTGGAGGASKKD